MIVGRISGAAKTIIKQFENTKILELLQTAMSLSANRQSNNDQQHAIASDDIRSKARAIMADDVLKTFPKDMREIFLKSGYASALPSNIARVIANGTTRNRLGMISSPELSVYQTAAQALLAELGNMVSSFNKFGIEDIHVPDNNISFDVFIPRSAFENEANKFVDISKAFIDVMASLQHVSTDSRDNPILVYTSTTDPVTGIAIVLVAATPFLVFYDKLLDVAKKHIELIKLIKTVRESSLSISPDRNLEDQIKESTTKSISDAVRDVVEKSAAPTVDSGTRAEVITKITMKSNLIVSAIANGARVSVSIESESDISHTFNSAGLDYNTFKSLQDHSRSLETAVSENLRLLNSDSLLMIESDSTKQ